MSLGGLYQPTQKVHVVDGAGASHLSYLAGFHSLLILLFLSFHIKFAELLLAFGINFP